MAMKPLLSTLSTTLTPMVFSLASAVRSRSKDFAGWMHDALMARDEAALKDWQARAPHAALAHPSQEHLMPLFTAYGAGGESTERLHTSSTYGSLRMDAYAFN